MFLFTGVIDLIIQQAALNVVLVYAVMFDRIKM